MSDIFNEIEQDLREERTKLLWQKYGNYVIAAAVVIVLLVAGRQGLMLWQEKTLLEDANRYNVALSAEVPQQALAEIAAETGEGYPMLARFRQAALLAENGDAAAAEAAYLDLAEDTSLLQLYRDLAMILAVMQANDKTSAETRLQRLEAIAAGDTGVAHLAAEMMIGLALETGDAERAGQLLEQLMARPGLDSASRQRLRFLQQALG